MARRAHRPRQSFVKGVAMREVEKLYETLRKMQESKGYYFNKDKDIICPCVYRDDDIREYGSCYCNLYVSKEWNEGKIPHTFVPERRPPEKFF